MSDPRNMIASDAAALASAMEAACRIGGLLGDATTYHLVSGGKAWRAGLALSCGRALGVGEQDIIALAAACELVHQASIVHDDVQDRAPLRRGRQSVGARFGESVAICAGDHLLVSGFAILAPLPQGPALTRLFAAGISEMAASQAEEFRPTLWQGMTWARYEELIAGKAGAMVTLALAGAALLAGLPASDVAQVGQAARMLGQAYQAGDDIDDLAADLLNGSLNGVIARRLDTAAETERAHWLAVLARARSQGLSQAEASRWAGCAGRDRDFVSTWAEDLRAGAFAMVLGRTSLRCHAVVPVIHRAAEALSKSRIHRWENRDAA